MQDPLRNRPLSAPAYREREWAANKDGVTGPELIAFVSVDPMLARRRTELSICDSEQRGIVAYLDDLQAKVDRLKALQAQTTVELDALLPSILDKAFKWEL